MRIWYQYPGPVSPFRKEVVFGSVHAVLDRVKRPDTDVSIVPTTRGVTNWADWTTEYSRNLTNLEIADTVAQAGGMGYDGVIIGMSGDPGIHMAKELCDVPVVGLTEASYHFALMWGDTFAVIRNAGGSASPLSKDIRRRRGMMANYGVLDRCVGDECVEMPQQDYLAMLARREHGPIIEQFIRQAQRLVNEDGAEVIVIGDTVLAMACVANNLFSIPNTGAVVIDPISSAIKLVEAQVDMHKAFGIVRSRAGIYAGPKPGSLTTVRENFQNVRNDLASPE